MKSFNKVLSSLLMSGILLAGVGVTAQAADTSASSSSSSSATTTAAENRDGTTKITATFTANSKEVTPVDPGTKKPTDKGDNNNGGKPGGGLSLIYVSNKLDFGSHEIDAINDNTYTAGEKDSATDGLYDGKTDLIEVSDVRGTNGGWTLSVTGSTLTGTDGAKIKGATLALPAGSVSNTGADSNGATATAVTDALNGSAATVLSAKANTGAGVTMDQIQPGDIKLMIPANTAKAQAYSSTLTWSLSDTPAS